MDGGFGERNSIAPQVSYVNFLITYMYMVELTALIWNMSTKKQTVANKTVNYYTIVDTGTGR